MRTPLRETARGVRALKRRKRAARRREASFGVTAFVEARSTAAGPTQVIKIIIMPPGGQQKCAKCGGTGHLAVTCTSSKELRERCLCDQEEDLEWCGNHISESDWKKGYRISTKCKNFKAGALALLGRIGEVISQAGKRPKLLKAPKNIHSGTNEALLARRAQNEREGRARREGNSGPRPKREQNLSLDDLKQEHVDRLTAASKTERDGHGCLEVANEFWDIVDGESPIAPRLCIRLPDPSANIMREQNGDFPPGKKGRPTPGTIRCLDSMIYWMKMVRDGVFVQCCDVELQSAGGDKFKAAEQKDGVGGAWASTCWESALSESSCTHTAPITRRAYDCVDESKNEYKKIYVEAKNKTVKVVISGPTLSTQEQQAVLQSRDPRYPIMIQKGPEIKLVPWLLCIAVALWDMVDAMNRACGHENGGKNNERITMPVNTDFLGWVFDRKFEHRAEPDTRDEIYFSRELGLALYWKLKKDPKSRVDEIIDEHFPGTDPTKWDFSSFMRSAPAPAPGKKRKRATREPLGDYNESEDECEWDSDEHFSDNE